MGGCFRAEARPRFPSEADVNCRGTEVPLLPASGAGPVLHRRLRDVAVPFRVRRPDPPRCCTDLQRSSTRRSHSVGFLAPPTSLDLSVWTLASSGGWLPGQLPVRYGAAPGLVLTLEDPVRVLVRASGSVHVDRSLFTPDLPWGFPLLRRSQSRESLSRRYLTLRITPFRVVPPRGEFPHPPGPPSPFLAALTV